MCVCVSPGETVPTCQCRPPVAGLLQSLSAAGEGGPRQRAWTHELAGGRQAESPPHRKE